jgi:hypothetical protein
VAFANAVGATGSGTGADFISSRSDSSSSPQPPGIKGLGALGSGFSLSDGLAGWMAMMGTSTVGLFSTGVVKVFGSGSGGSGSTILGTSGSFGSIGMFGAEEALSL